MRILLFLFLLSAFKASSQTLQVMDFVKIKNGHAAEALFYYEHNWKMYRDVAVKNGNILSYRLERTEADTVAAFDLVLITEYKDSVQYNNREVNFRAIIQSLRPAGPLLMNTLQPDDFRKNEFVKVTRNIFRSYTLQATSENPGHLE